MSLEDDDKLILKEESTLKAAGVGMSTFILLFTVVVIKLITG